jgi:2-keto-3-deoxy-L-rhamnonate aldolase RhmA
VILQVESTEAIANLDKITRVRGVDVLLIGPSDLSISLGIPGQFENPRFLEAAEQTFKVCLQNGVSPSIFSLDLEMANRYQNLGMNFILYSTEMTCFVLLPPRLCRYYKLRRSMSGRSDSQTLLRSIEHF